MWVAYTLFEILTDLEQGKASKRMRLKKLPEFVAWFSLE